MDWQNQIESLTNASDHLSYASHLISQQDIPAQTKKLLASKFAVIGARLRDENLYVAVVGRASTGKSTFINALLKDVLLESGAVQGTTTAATFITYGKELSAEIRFKDPDKLEALGLKLPRRTAQSHHSEILPDKLSVEQTFLVKLSTTDEPIAVGDERMTLRDFIRLISSEGSYAQHIVSLAIRVPTEFLRSGIVIIDTPGADANDLSHKEITRKAVEKADAAIIITPGEQAISASLLNMLKDPAFLYPLLHRCAYMMTRMDHVTRSARRQSYKDAIQLVSQDAVRRLEDGLAQINRRQKPKIYMSAAQIVLDELAEEEDTSIDLEEKRYWLQEFARFEQEFMKYLLYQRAETVADSVFRLLDDLFEALELHFSELWRHYNERSGKLEAILKDIDEFCNDQLQLWKRLIRQVRVEVVNEVELAIAQERDRAVNDIQSGIFGADSVKALGAYVNTGIQERLQRSSDRIATSVKWQTQAVTQKAMRFNDSFELEFNTLYQELKLIAQARNIQGTPNLKNAASDISLADVTALEEFSAGQFLGGAALGALIGSIIPGIGTLFGALLGGAISSFMGPSLDERKEKVWAQVRPQIMEYYSKSKEMTTEAIKTYCDDVRRKVEDHIMAYKKKYGAEVAQIRNVQIRERQELEKQQAGLEADLTELKARRLQVQEQREDLRMALHKNISL